MANISSYQEIDMKTLFEVMKEIRERINSDKYHICKRGKNDLFKLKFRFTNKTDYKKVLLSLTMDDFVKSDYEDQASIYGSGIVYIFIKSLSLYNMHGERESISLYIKIKIPDTQENLPIISFHECEN